MKVEFAKQRGVALISVMIVVAAAVVLGVQMTTEQSLAINRASGFIREQQAREYARGGEELARQILALDLRDSPGKDFLGEEWAVPQFTFEFDEGGMTISITDLSAKLNVNNLRGNTGGEAVSRERFNILARDLSIDPMFIDRLVDWLDADDAVNQLGAEDYQYLGLDRAYRTSGQPAVDVSELRLLFEMDEESYQRIEPYITAIPDSGTKLNVNTTSAVVLKTLSPTMTIESAEAFVIQRDENDGYDSVDSFVSEPLLQGGLNSEGLDVQSSYFEVSVTATFEDRVAYLTSIVQRDQDGGMRVIYRDMSKKIQPLVADNNN